MPKFELVDVRQVDGEPYEVAEQAGTNLVEAIRFGLETAEDFNWAARGAWMSAEEHRTGEMPDGATFAQTTQGANIAALYDELEDALRRVRVLHAAASWNPRSTV